MYNITWGHCCAYEHVLDLETNSGGKHMLNFEKMHGTGNDFIIINGMNKNLDDYSSLAQKTCDRHFGIGADGMIVVENSNVADIKMVFYNADGTEAPMCGNGIRCFSKYVYDNNIIQQKLFKVETLGGIMEPELNIVDGIVDSVRVNMGSPKLSTESFPINTKEDTFINKEIKINDKTYNISTLSVGTIHSIIKVDSLDMIDIKKIGPSIENFHIFPKKTNVNFCEIVDKSNIKMLTWERGVGQTLACGTGACASSFICNELYNTKEKVNIHLLGGVLEIELIDGIIFMTGPAKLICKGVFYLS